LGFHPSRVPHLEEEGEAFRGAVQLLSAALKSATVVLLRM
jgi:hypothetical protein